MKISCFRFGNNPSVDIQEESAVLKRRKLSKKLVFDQFTPIGVANNKLFSKNICGELLSSLYKLDNDANIIVLTNREKLLIFESGILHQQNIISLEEYFPFLKGIYFASDAKKNFENLIKWISYLKSRTVNLDFFHNYYRECDKKLKRKLYKISSLDQFFFFFPIYAYQEVFKFKQNSPEKQIISLDFNSMYSDSMSGLFPNPRKLKKISIKDFFHNGRKLSYGIYRAILEHPDEFIQKYHAIKFFHLSKTYPLAINKTDRIETYLTNLEIDYYSEHFEKIYIEEGIISEEVIRHPLLKNRDNLYSDRLNFKKQNNIFFANLRKYMLTILHSVSNSNVKASRYFNNTEQVCEFLKNQFGFDIPTDESQKNRLLLSLINRNFYFQFSYDGLKLTYPQFSQSQNVYSLFAFVVSNARLKMMKTIELLKQFPNLDICYINVDSIHVSIKRHDLNEFNNFLQKNNLLGEKLGQLKIETVADYGLWVSPGKYWLYSNSEIIQSRNSCLQQPFDNNSHNIRLSQKKVILQKTDEYIVPNIIDIIIRKTFSVRKKLNEQDNRFERFTVDEIKNITTDYEKHQKSIFTNEIISLKNYMSEKNNVSVQKQIKAKEKVTLLTNDFFA